MLASLHRSAPSPKKRYNLFTARAWMCLHAVNIVHFSDKDIAIIKDGNQNEIAITFF